MIFNMPIKFDLEALRKDFNCKVYIETGLYDPEYDISCKIALKSNFEKIYSIEIRNDLIEKAKNYPIYNDTRLKIIQGDSAYLGMFLSALENKERFLFFLDAHVDNGKIPTTKMRCPLFCELEAISKLERKDHIICIDDIRCFKQPYPWGEISYGNISYFDAIKRSLLGINNNYKFRFEEGCLKDDVMIAYV